MHDCGEKEEFEAAVRRAYASLLEVDLPRAGRSRGWPWTNRAQFEALLHGHLSDGRREQPGCLLDMVLALNVGERLLRGDLRWTALRARELALQEAAAGEARHR